MSKNQVDMLQIAALCFFVGFVLTRNPHCSKGCRTLAEHLISHGIDEMIAGLL